MSNLREELGAIEVGMPVGEYNYEWELDEMLGDPVEKVIDVILQALPEETYHSLPANKGGGKVETEYDKGRNQVLTEFRTILEQAKENK